MNSLLDGGEQLEQELTPEPMMAPAAGSLLLHLALAACLLTYGLVAGLFHHNQWGDAGSGGAIQVSLTSALPLPSDQPPNENVLATDTPSQAPAEPAPKAREAVDETAIPISGKQKQQQENARKAAQHQAEMDKRAQYGEQAGSSMARAMQSQGYTNGQTTISDGNFGSLFGWYVDGINRKMTSSAFRQEVDPHTPRGSRAYIQFAIHRDGTASNVQMSQSSGSSTLDRACMRAAQRVDTFGALPAQYNQNTLMTSYYCEY
ncbi:MAG: TonB family protein [Terracidiphilus sp.]|jgi:protein TonB